MSTIGLTELESITRFLEARSLAGSSRDIRDWCVARRVDAEDVLFIAASLTRSCLETIAGVEERTGEQADTSQVESAIAAAIVTALQVGVDAERRRRDEAELPV